MSDHFDFESVPTLTSDRILLREVKPAADLPNLFALFGAPNVARFTDTGPFETLEDAVEVMDWIMQIFERSQGLRWAICLTEAPNNLIGNCGFNVLNRSNDAADVGYDLMERHWGAGIMTEALGPAVDFGFRHMQLNRIEAGVTVGNDASARVLQKVGFVEEGLLRQHGHWKGAYHDIRFFSLLRSDWDPE